MLFLNTKDFVEHGYGNYASADVNIFGWGCILFVVIFADFLTTLKGKEGYADLDKISQKEVAKNEYKCNNPDDNRLCRSLGRLWSIVRDSIQTQQKRKIVKSILSTLFSL